jgi:hypothetical protein
MEILWPKLISNAYVLIDDYGWIPYPGKDCYLGDTVR